MSDTRSPREVFEAYVAAVNAGDIDVVMELFDDDVAATDMIRGRFGVNGGNDHAAVRNYIDSTVIRNHGEITLIRVASVDEWAYGVLELRGTHVSGLGLERIRGIDELCVRAGKVVAFSFIPDAFEAQTAKFLQAIAGDPSGQQAPD